MYYYTYMLCPVVSFFNCIYIDNPAIFTQSLFLTVSARFTKIALQKSSVSVEASFKAISNLDWTDSDH